ncbi:MAG: ankyrin repeat domain-containing protein [Sphaerochaetaceae bacterium]|nr:ankyrin repeat domain-containing protein [Sphaerochaetaceae bacterium]
MKKFMVLVLCLTCTLAVFATDLFDMIETADIEGVKQVIGEGANVNAVSSDGMTALTYAIVSKIENPDQGFEILDLLLKAGADINQEIEYFNEENISPLSVSIIFELEGKDTAEEILNTDYEVALWLIKHGADVNVRVDGIPMFFIAVITGTPELLEAMISCGLQVNARSEEGYTAISLLLGLPEEPFDGFQMTDRHYEAFELLIKAGINVNAWDEDSMNALLYAAKSYDANMVRFLLESGADAKLFNPDGESAFDYAKSNNALINTDEYWLLCDAHYEAIDNLIRTMQSVFVLND